MIKIHGWAAVGTDIRFPHGISIYFDYEAPEWIVQLVLQRHHGYPIHVADRFPLIANLYGATPRDDLGNMEYTLDKDLEIQGEDMRGKVIPKGTVVQFKPHYELLYSPLENL
jgi:hypothetical protein